MIDFLILILRGFRCSGLKTFLETKLRLQLNRFTQKLDFDVLWFSKRTAYKILENKKQKTKKKNSSRPKMGW